MRKRLRKKRRRVLLERLNRYVVPGFERFAQALYDVVIDGLDVPVEVLLVSPPCTIWLDDSATPPLKPDTGENTLEGAEGGRCPEGAMGPRL